MFYIVAFSMLTFKHRGIALSISHPYLLTQKSALWNCKHFISLVKSSFHSFWLSRWPRFSTILKEGLSSNTGQYFTLPTALDLSMFRHSRIFRSIRSSNLVLMPLCSNNLYGGRRAGHGRASSRWRRPFSLHPLSPSARCLALKKSIFPFSHHLEKRRQKSASGCLKMTLEPGS